MPELRRRVLETLHKHGEMKLKDVSKAVLHPKTTVRRVCEDLVCHGILAEIGEDNKNVWCMTRSANDLMDVLDPSLDDLGIAVPEKSEDTTNTSSANTHQINRESRSSDSGDSIEDTQSA